VIAPLRLAIAIPAVALAAFGIFRTSLVARADLLARRDTVAALTAAAAILPANALFHARIAELDPSRSGELDRALVLNPRNASWWIMRSVQQEESGDLAGTEASLRSSVAVARYYVPLWSLTAFYYRQANVPAFIRSAKDTLSVGSGDPRSLFQMATKLNLTPEVIEKQILPDRPETQSAWLAYSVERENWPSVTQTARRLTAAGSKTDAPAVLSACERLFLAGKLDESVAVWNAAIGAGWFSLNRLNPAAGASLTDETFSAPRIGLGFDWKVIAPAEVAVSFSAEHYARLEFSGDEPESVDLLSQYLPLLPARRYKLTARSRTEDLPPATGLHWLVTALTPTRTVEALSPNLSGEDVTETSLEFETLPQPTPFRLMLIYRREPGTTRIKGRLWVQSLRLELLKNGSR
jgi:hypothetical protein